MTEIYKIKNNHAPPTHSTHYVSFIPVSWNTFNVIH